MTGNPGDVFHIKGIADEIHYHDKLEQKISKLEILVADLRAEWDEFIEAQFGHSPGGGAGPGVPERADGEGAGGSTVTGRAVSSAKERPAATGRSWKAARSKNMDDGTPVHRALAMADEIQEFVFEGGVANHEPGQANQLLLDAVVLLRELAAVPANEWG